MTAILLTQLYVGMGLTLVYSGLAFLNSNLVPSLLQSVYDSTENTIVRLVVATLIFFAPANLLTSKGFATAGPAWAGAGMVIFTVLGMTITALLLENAKINWWITGGTATAVFGSLMVVYGIHQ